MLLVLVNLIVVAKNSKSFMVKLPEVEIEILRLRDQYIKMRKVIDFPVVPDYSGCSTCGVLSRIQNKLFCCSFARHLHSTDESLQVGVVERNLAQLYCRKLPNNCTVSRQNISIQHVVDFCFLRDKLDFCNVRSIRQKICARAEASSIRNKNQFCT